MPWARNLLPRLDNDLGRGSGTIAVSRHGAFELSDKDRRGRIIDFLGTFTFKGLVLVDDETCGFERVWEIS